MDHYLKETPMLDFSDESIRWLIENRKWRKIDEFERVRSIYNFVRDEILFGYNTDDSIPASKVLHKNKKCTMFTDKVQDQHVLESKASQNSKYELDWKFDYQKGVDEFYNTYTECGICKLGKRENCFESVPCLCNMDERNYRNEGGQLHRTKTLANGDACCNFHVTRIK